MNNCELKLRTLITPISSNTGKSRLFLVKFLHVRSEWWPPSHRGCHRIWNPLSHSKKNTYSTLPQESNKLADLLWRKMNWRLWVPVLFLFRTVELPLVRMKSSKISETNNIQNIMIICTFLLPARTGSPIKFIVGQVPVTAELICRTNPFKLWI